MKDLVAINCCDNNYEHFIPWFLLFFLDSYPEYSIRILHPTKPRPETYEYLQYLEGDFKIVENAFPDFKLNEQGNVGRYIKNLHYLTYLEEFKNFKYLLILGDVDMLIMRDAVSILEAHTKHMEITGLPFSVGIRWDVYPKIKRIFSRSFYEIDTWFRKAPYKKYRQLLKEGKLLREGKGDLLRDEEVAYMMIEEMNLGFPPKMTATDFDVVFGKEIGDLKREFPNFWWPRGLHLGYFKSKTVDVNQCIRKYRNLGYWWKGSECWNRYREQLLKLRENKVWLKMPKVRHISRLMEAIK